MSWLVGRFLQNIFLNYTPKNARLVHLRIAPRKNRRKIDPHHQFLLVQKPLVSGGVFYRLFGDLVQDQKSKSLAVALSADTFPIRLESYHFPQFLDPVVMVRYLGVRSGGVCCEDFVFSSFFFEDF